MAKGTLEVLLVDAYGLKDRESVLGCFNCINPCNTIKMRPYVVIQYENQESTSCVADQGSPQEESPKRAETLAAFKARQQQKKKRKLVLTPKESESQNEQREIEQEQEIPLQRTKRTKVAAPSSDLVEDSNSETIAKVMEKELTSEGLDPQLEEREIEPVVPLPRKKRKKVTVPATDLVEDPIHEAAAKAVEQEHSKAIIVFERAEKRRQQQFLRDEAAAADAIQRDAARRQHIAEHYSLRSSPIAAVISETTTTTEPILPMRTPSVSVEVDQMQNVRAIQILLTLPRLTLSVPSLRPSIPVSLSSGLKSYLPFLSFDLPNFIFLSSPALFPPPKEISAVAPSLMVADSSVEGARSSPTHGLLSLPSSSPSSLDILVARTIETAENAPPISPIPMQSSVPSTTALSAPLMSTDEVDIFETRLASLSDIPSTSPTVNDEAEPLVLANSLLEILESSSSSSNKPSAPLIDLDTCLELLTSFSRIPFEALQRPIIRNGFLQCCKVAEQSGMNVSSHLSQAATTIDFYISICQAAKAADEKLTRDQSFVSQVHTEVSELKEQHSSASYFRVQLLERKARLEEELSAVNQALVRTDTKLLITNQGLADRKEEMTVAIQLFSSFNNRKSVIKEQLRHCNDF